MDSVVHSLVNTLISAFSHVHSPIVKCLDFFKFFVSIHFMHMVKVFILAN